MTDPLPSLAIRSSLAAWASATSRLSRYPGPILRADAPRESVIAWLRWCDPNGSYADDDADRIDCGPLTHRAAWAMVGCLWVDGNEDAARALLGPAAPADPLDLPDAVFRFLDSDASGDTMPAAEGWPLRRADGNPFPAPAPVNRNTIPATLTATVSLVRRDFDAAEDTIARARAMGLSVNIGDPADPWSEVSISGPAAGIRSLLRSVGYSADEVAALFEGGAS